MAGLKEKDLLFVRYERGSQHTECLPYYIALDQETKSVGAALQVTPANATLGPLRVLLVLPCWQACTGKEPWGSNLSHRVRLLLLAAPCMTRSAWVS